MNDWIRVCAADDIDEIDAATAVPPPIPRLSSVGSRSGGHRA